MKNNFKYKWFWILVVLLVIYCCLTRGLLNAFTSIYISLRSQPLTLTEAMTATANLDQFALNVSLYVKPVVFAAICGVNLKILYDVLKKIGFE